MVDTLTQSLIVADTLDDIITNDGTPLAQLNVGAQITANAAAWKGFASPGAAAAAFSAAGVAAATALPKLLVDIQNIQARVGPNSSWSMSEMASVSSDAATLLGDVALMAGAVASQIPIPTAKGVAAGFDATGNFLTGVGVSSDLVPYVQQAVASFVSKLTNTVSADATLGMSVLQDTQLSLGTSSPAAMSFTSGAVTVTRGQVANQFGTGLQLNSDGSFTLQSESGTGIGEAGSKILDFSTSGQLAKSIVYSDDNTVTNNYGDNVQLTSSDIIYKVGGSANTTYNASGSGGRASETNVYDASGDLIGTATVNQDGTATLVNIDPGTGKPILTTQLDATGKVISQTGSALSSSALDYSHFVQAVADTLATQIISNFLIKNNLPASIMATAFADATIHSALAPAGQSVNFTQDLSNSIFDIAGGVVGSDVGSLVAKALGVPIEAGTLIGGVTGNLVAQTLVNEVASDLGIAKTSGAALTAGDIASGFAASGGAVLGSTLASLIVPPSAGSQITGAVSTAAVLALFAPTEAFLLTNPVTAALEVFAFAFGSSFLGDLIGSFLFGSHPSVGPDASAAVRWNATAQQFYVSSALSDNGATPAQIRAEGNALAGVMNQIVTAIGGGPAGLTQDMNLYWFKNSFYYGFGNTTAKSGGYSDPSKDVETAAITWLKSLNIQGGNPYMTYVLSHTTDTTLNTLISDLNAAHDYSLYVANPMAFNAGLALRNDPAALQTWLAEETRAQALGLDHLTARDIYNLKTYGVTSPWQLDGSGGWNYYQPLTTSGGQSFSFSGRTVIGGGLNFQAMGDRDYFVRNSSNGQLAFFEFNAYGKQVASEGLLNTTGAPFTVSSGTAAIGTDVNAAGKRGKDIILWTTDGRVSVNEFDPTTGKLLASIQLSNANSTPFTLEKSALIVNRGNNLLNHGGIDYFIKHADGHVTLAEFDIHGKLLGSIGVIMGDNTPLKLNPGDTVLGVSHDLIAKTGLDVLVLRANATVDFFEIGGGTNKVWASGHLLFGDDSPFTVEPGSTVVGTTNTFFGLNLPTVFIRTPDGHVGAFAFEPGAGQVWASGTLVHTDRTPVIFNSTTTILGETDNYAGLGGVGFTVYDASHGTYTVMQFNNSGQEVFEGAVAIVGNHTLSTINGSTVASFDGAHDALDIANLTFDPSLTEQFTPNTGGHSGNLVIAEHGSTLATIHLQSVVNMSSFEAMPDGTGGTLIIDPVLTENAALPNRSEHSSGSNAWASHFDSFVFEPSSFRDAFSAAGKAVSVGVDSENDRLVFETHAIGTHDMAHVGQEPVAQLDNLSEDHVQAAHALLVQYANALVSGDHAHDTAAHPHDPHSDVVEQHLLAVSHHLTL
jgi:hypothetical protein